jgi:hypothetical protein
MREKVELALEKEEKDGILKPVDFSQWASPIVTVLKPDGSVRLCADFKITINSELQVHSHPFPTVQDIFAKLHGGEKFTKLDMSRTYNQIELDEDSQNLCVINTHKGLRKYTRLMFGVAPAPMHFQRRMDQILSGCKGAGWYIDDIIVTGRNDKEHLANLNAVLKRLADNGARLNESKCEFLKDSLEFLGHVIDKNGICPSPKNVESLLKMREPENIPELQSFLGKVNFYCNFIPNQSSLCAPLYDLLRQGAEWKWSDQCVDSYRKLKQIIASEPLLVHFDPRLPIVVACDASPVGISAILSHRYEDGSERPIIFKAKALDATQRKYSQIDKEAFAIAFSVKKFQQFLYGRKFILVTDHKPLTAIFGPKAGIPTLAVSRLQRYALLLSAFDYSIEYRKSKNNGNADALSRLPDPSTESESDDIAEEVISVMEMHFSEMPLTISEIARQTTDNALFQKIIHFCNSVWPKGMDLSAQITQYPALRAFANKQQELSVDFDCLFWKNRIVLPDSIRKRFLESLHETHPGIVSMKSIARRYVWWPSIRYCMFLLLGF